MADQVPFVPTEETSVESSLAVAVVSEQELPPVPLELIVQVPEPDVAPVRRRGARTRTTARKSVLCRRAYFKLSCSDEPQLSHPPPPPSPIKKVIESRAENSVSEEEPMEMEPELSEQSLDDTAQSKFTLTFAKASDFPGPCPYGFCGWLDE